MPSVTIEDISRRLAAIERIQGGNAVVNRPQRYERPPEEATVRDLQTSAVATTSGAAMVVTWVDSEDRRVNGYEVWAKEAGDAEAHLVTKVERAPATFIYPVSSDTPTQFLVRPLYRDGGGAALERAVSGALSVPAIVVPSTQITNPSQVNPGVINNTHLDRATANRIQIVNADIANLAVTNAKISDLAAAKITAGTFVAGVVYAGAVAASQITAGTMTAVNVSAGTYSLISGSNTMTINGTFGFQQAYNPSGTNYTIEIFNGQVNVGISGSGRSRMRTQTIGDPNVGSGDILVFNTSETEKVRLLVNSLGDGEVRINGTKVLGPRQTDPGASPTTDQLRAVLLAHGLI